MRAVAPRHQQNPLLLLCRVCLLTRVDLYTGCKAFVIITFAIISIGILSDVCFAIGSWCGFASLNTLLQQTCSANDGHSSQRVYETVARLSVCLSVRLTTSSHHSHAVAAGLLLSAVPAGDIARQRRLSTAYSSTLWFVCVRCYQVLVGLASVAVVIYLVSCDISCAPCSKKGKHQTHGRNSVKCQFSTDFQIFLLSDSPVNLQQSIKDPIAPHVADSAINLS